jgi:hypothetical protein
MDGGKGSNRVEIGWLGRIEPWVDLGGNDNGPFLSQRLD